MVRVAIARRPDKRGLSRRQWPEKDRAAKMLRANRPLLIRSPLALSFPSQSSVLVTAAAAPLQRLLQFLGVLQMALQQGRRALERRLEFGVLGIRDKRVRRSINHRLVVGNFMRHVFPIEVLAFQATELLAL